MQQHLKRQGHEPFVIRYVPSNYTSPQKRLLKKVLCVNQIRLAKDYFFDRKAYLLKQSNQRNDRKRKFDEFREKYLDVSDCIYYDIHQIQKNPPVADAYVVGSDQVWAQMLDSRNSGAYFLDFGKPETKRIAYAPSFVVKEHPAASREELK